MSTSTLSVEMLQSKNKSIGSGFCYTLVIYDSVHGTGLHILFITGKIQDQLT